MTKGNNVKRKVKTVSLVLGSGGARGLLLGLSIPLVLSVILIINTDFHVKQST